MNEPRSENHRLPQDVGPGEDLHLNLLSFGHKYGPPPAADLVFDARVLPNPYWVEKLRPRHGLEAEIAAFVLANPTGARFLALHLELLQFILAEARAARRPSLTVAVGCTGGRHRSPAVAQALAAALAAATPVNLEHRDINRE